jgi:hypothetical protein
MLASNVDDMTKSRDKQYVPHEPLVREAPLVVGTSGVHNKPPESCGRWQALISQLSALVQNMEWTNDSTINFIKVYEKHPLFI